MIRSRFCCLFVILLLFNVTVQARSAESALLKLLSNFHALSANFSQQLLSNGKVKQQSHGKMAIQRPDHFRWDVSSPNRQVIIADGKTLWIYDRDLKQVTKQPLDKKRGSSPAYLLSGSLSSLQQAFNVNWLKNEKNEQSFHLKPKGKPSFQWADLYFKNGKISGMRLKDNLGTVSVFNFQSVQLNPNLSDWVFKFTPPKGVDVITNT